MGKFKFDFENTDKNTSSDKIDDFTFYQTQGSSKFKYSNGWGLAVDYDGAHNQILVIDENGLH